MKLINTKMFLQMFEGGCKTILKNFEYMNELNVFPVPDGDTGSNLKITTNSTLDLVKQSVSSTTTLYELSKLISRQLLMNARGNSGVIFSQIFRGFFDPITEDTTEIDVKLFKECLVKAKEKAYKSISNPIEGTILTIIRVVSEEVNKNEFADIEELLKFINTAGFEALKTTPDLLPSLKEAKVVDSGGYGLCKFFEGMYLVLTGEEIVEDDISNKNQEITNISATSKVTFINSKERLEISEEGFGYCCEFIIELNFKTTENQPGKLKWNKISFEKELLEIGDSLIIINDNDIVKIHIHSLTPYKVLQIGQKYGEFLKIKIDNMTKQFLDNHPEISQDDLFNKFKMTDDIRIVATVPTDEVAQYYKDEFNINNILVTEKKGIPSTNEILIAIKNTNSKNVLIVTDDANIILSAEQASLLQKDKCNIQIARCKNTMESLFACMVFQPDYSLTDNIKEINKIIKKSVTGLISTSIKTAKFDGVTVNKDDYIGIVDKKIVLAEKSSELAASSIIKHMFSKIKKPQMVYIVYGSEIKIREIRNIEKFVNESYGIKCKIIPGNQNLYKYYIGIY